jgi:hypothetical protein
VSVNRCCILIWMAVGWSGGGGTIGTLIWGRCFYDGLLWTDLVGLSLVGGGWKQV